jgi:hypothetical protein
MLFKQLAQNMISRLTTDIQRRNIRKILTKAQENHADDAFDQTPLKNQSNALLFSPSIATPPNFPVKGPLSLLAPTNGGSPVPDLLRPVNHDAADAYVNRLQRNRRAGGGGGGAVVRSICMNSRS